MFKLVLTFNCYAATSRAKLKSAIEALKAVIH